MNVGTLRLWQTPQRLNAVQIKVIGGCAVFILGLATLGLFANDGWQRYVHFGALALVGLANLVWVVGSLLPEGHGARAARNAMVPLTLLMFATLIWSLALYIRADGIDVGIVVSAAVGGIVAFYSVRYLFRGR